jgi:hypothetical protein
MAAASLIRCSIEEASSRSKVNTASVCQLEFQSCSVIGEHGADERMLAVRAGEVSKKEFEIERDPVCSQNGFFGSLAHPKRGHSDAVLRAS